MLWRNLHVNNNDSRMGILTNLEEGSGLKDLKSRKKCLPTELGVVDK